MIEHEFSKSDVRVLLEASTSGMPLSRVQYHLSGTGIITGRRPQALAEELEGIEMQLPLIDNTSQKYFARLSECSTKDGIYGCGPFTSRARVLDSLVTSERY